MDEQKDPKDNNKENRLLFCLFHFNYRQVDALLVRVKYEQVSIYFDFDNNLRGADKVLQNINIFTGNKFQMISSLVRCKVTYHDLASYT